MVKPDAHDALYYSQSPVIYGAPPDSNSKYAFAKQMYANLKCNPNGAARKSSTSATCLKKKNGESVHDVEVISIPDSDEIMPNPVPHAKVKHPAPSVHDSDEIEEIPPVIRKSTWLQPRVVIVQPPASKKCTRQVVESDKNNDDSVDIGDLEYNPDDKASSDEGSDTEEVRVADEGNVLEDERQSLSCKCKCTFDDTAHTSKRLATNPKPVKTPSTNPITLSSKGKGKSLNITADVAVENEDDALGDERQMSHEYRVPCDDTECPSKRPAINMMLIESPPTHPAMSSSRDKGNSQNVTDNKATDISPHTESGLDASEANQSLHTISLTPLPSPDEDGHIGIPKKIQVEKGEAGRMEMEDARLGADKRATDSMQGMACQPTGFPPPQYVYYPMHHPWRMRYDQDPYVAQYRAAQAFPDHPSSFVPDPWEDGHADYENQMQYMRGGGQYGPQDPSNQFPAYQGPYPPPRDHPNDAIPGYYYHRTCAQPPPQSLQLPALHGSTHSNLTPGTSPWPPQQQTYLPPAQSTMLPNRDTPPKSKSYLELLTHPLLKKFRR
ncbi:hypothetical protein PISMIDRAFT_16907 [Pisolithus microcarpus 441]|uniref:Uncharacterized protein n=1 Tax=Pisolithus microcarpus 441 TaxID=765257 RepID=A0A0C9Z4K1_9AGAM|nr:hypothetical protein PISMIDRAFT_16907 [Pisolithus microcarpus 441]